MHKNRDSVEQKVESMDIEQLRHGNTIFSLAQPEVACYSPSQILTLTYWLLSHAANTPFLLSSQTDVIKHLQDKIVLLFECFVFVSFPKAPCPPSHTAFYCLGERNLMTFQQYSNYSPGGVCRGRSSLTPKQILFQTAYLHLRQRRAVVASGYSSCNVLHEWKHMFLFLMSVSLSEISLS